MDAKISDIARMAGVSQATVSRVINSPHRVKESTRKKVLEAMEAGNYVYNALAGGLSRKHTDTIGLIIPTITNPVFALSTKGVQKAAGDKGYSMLLGSTDYSAEMEYELVKLFQEKRADGVIFTGTPANPKSVEFLKSLNIPYIVTWDIPDDEDTCFVTFDNVNAGRQATSYLLSLGHRRIAMIAGRFPETGRAHKRWVGYTQALAAAGIPADESLVVQRRYTVSDGKEAMMHFLNHDPPPTAVFCGNDILAYGAMAVVRASGLRVGEDVSVVGFDDLEESAVTDPPLTTLRVPAYRMGSLGASLLIGLIEGEVVDAPHYMLETDLVVRGSARNPPASD